MDVVQQLVDGRRAYEERAWATAYQRLSALDLGTLDDEDCFALATAAYLAGDREAAARAFAGVVPPPRGGGRHPGRGARHLLARVSSTPPPAT